VTNPAKVITNQIFMVYFPALDLSPNNVLQNLSTVPEKSVKTFSSVLVTNSPPRLFARPRAGAEDAAEAWVSRKLTPGHL
jgi:hypothetical protein